MTSVLLQYEIETHAVGRLPQGLRRDKGLVVDHPCRVPYEVYLCLFNSRLTAQRVLQCPGA